MLVSQRRGGLIDACATMIRLTGACDCVCNSTQFIRAGLR
jgi:hypothetical protein